MTPAGYMAKRIESRPSWLKVENVRDVYSLSGCVSAFFCDYVSHWRHNGYWLFDSPTTIAEVARAEHVDLSQFTLFFYEIHEREFDEERCRWEPVTPESSFETNVQLPSERNLEGYDVVSFWARSTPEHSPLSCNHLAQTIPVNAHCLLPSLDEAVHLLEAGAFNHAEPGPYRVFAVNSCSWPH